MVLFFDDEFVATDQVVLAYGAESDRVLSIPGEVCRNFFVLFSYLLLSLWHHSSLFKKKSKIK